uniref:Uncharacterized protein n=1 Tax=Rhizophora mucronata TaxID=61149 RepID=A0A2P2MJP6_RHIMU
MRNKTKNVIVLLKANNDSKFIQLLNYSFNGAANAKFFSPL